MILCDMHGLLHNGSQKYTISDVVIDVIAHDVMYVVVDVVTHQFQRCSALLLDKAAGGIKLHKSGHACVRDILIPTNGVNCDMPQSKATSRHCSSKGWLTLHALTKQPACAAHWEQHHLLEVPISR